jgi:DHA2 family methylenomycin A resistance protein-like MFS transporter
MTAVAVRPTTTASRHAGFTLLAMCLGLFVAQLDTTAVNLALPAIGRRLGAGLAGLQWVVDAYNLAFAALLLTGGTLGDRLGRRRLFLVGVAAFLAGSVCCALAPGVGVLVAARAVQGCGAALAIPQSMAILAVAFPGRAARNRAMAAWSMVAAVALAAGPLLGGVLVDTAGWRFIFWLNVPVAVAAIGLAAWVVPESSDPAARPLDGAGQLLAVLALAALTFAVVQGGPAGWTSGRIVAAAAVAVLAGGAFLAVQARRRHPMLPLGLLRRGQLPVAALVAGCMTFGAYGLLLLASIDLQRRPGITALDAGLRLLPLPLVYAALTPLAARLATRNGPRLPMAAGLTLMGAGLLWYAALPPSAGPLTLGIGFGITGAGLALNTGPVVTVGVTAVGPDRAGLASGVVNLGRMLGATLGVAVLGAVLSAAERSTPGPAGFSTGLRVALLIGAAVELAGALLAATRVRDAR